MDHDRFVASTSIMSCTAQNGIKCILYIEQKDGGLDRSTKSCICFVNKFVDRTIHYDITMNAAKSMDQFHCALLLGRSKLFDTKCSIFISST